MKRIISFILSAVLFLGVFAVCSFAENEFVSEVGRVVCPYVSNKTPTINGVIGADERWSDPSIVNNQNTAPFWAYRSKCFFTIKMYYAWSDDGMYVAGEITDPTMTLSTGFDTTDGTGNISSDSYAGNGDLLIFALDPLSTIANRGDSNSDGTVDTAWYNIVPMAGDNFKICRTRYNNQDITSQVSGAVKTGENGWSFECMIPWSIIIADTFAAGNNSIMPVTSEQIAEIGKTSKAAVIYMDRAEYHTSDIYSGYHVGYLPDGTIFTITRSITVSNTLPDGSPGYYGNGIDATTYGISLYFEEGKVYRSNNIEYIYSNLDGNSRIIRFEADAGNYSVPVTLGGKTVTSIRAKAFDSVSSMKVFVPATVTDIEKDAFYCCANLLLYVEADSAAETYAVNNNISYKTVCSEHTPGIWKIIEESTCLKKGVRVQSCTVCGMQLSSVEIPYVEHELHDFEIQTKATCVSSGLMVLKCTLCGTVVETKNYQTGEHSFSPWLYSASSLCQGGYKKRTCSLCGFTEQSTENVNGCVGGKWTEAIPASETESGVMASQCVYCGKILKARFTGTLSKPISPFSDVPVKNWYFAAVEYVFNNRYMNGISGDTFAPDAMITRGMFAALLANMSGVNLSDYSSSSFSDVASAVYYSAPIAWASSVEIISGYSDGTFRPDTNITRQQTAALMYNYSKHIGLDVSYSGAPLEAFSDRGSIQNYALRAFSWAVYSGIINGNGNGELLPDSPITRAEVAQLIKNYCEKTGI